MKRYGKTVAIKGKRGPLAFLVKGLEWAVRKFEARLPPRTPTRKSFSKPSLPATGAASRLS